ncbi:MAG: ABC transporter ATP-binding protein [Candidatus Sumerlaeia bacterium]|nr:ABC transporter ATP-binding protein [Candidatus Sumerlaeia bacterium]
MIRLDRVSKRFRLHRSPGARLRSMLGLRGEATEFWALRDVNLVVPRGKTVGIVGQNGAGKSTLLKLITGTLIPTSGEISVEGRVAALLELGMGFHPEFSGRENIRINGQFLGMSLDEVLAREEDIVAFSELGYFIDQPLRTYSSGMQMRLAFAVASAMEPQVLIVDEALSVGDARFSQKCVRRIREFRDAGATILFVSHDPGAVLTLCDAAVLLDEGMVLSEGEPGDVLDEYNALIARQGQGNAEMKLYRAGAAEARGRRRSGTFQAAIRSVEVLNSRGFRSEIVVPGETATIRVTVDAFSKVPAPTVGILLRDRLGMDVFGTNTFLKGVAVPALAPGDMLEVEFRIAVNLGYGDYSITAAVHADRDHLEQCYEWSDRAAALHVRHDREPDWKGVALLPAEVSARVRKAGSAEWQQSLDEAFAELAGDLGPEGAAPSPFLAGFYHAERTGAGWQRWTASEALFAFRPAGARVCLELDLSGRRAAGIAETRVVLSLEGVGEVARVVTELERVALIGDVPEYVRGSVRLFRIEVDAPFVPADGGASSDRRELGVAFLWMKSLGVEEPAHVEI